MPIIYDDKETTFSQLELIPVVQSPIINPSMSMSDLLNVAQSASFNPTLLQDSPTIPPDTSNDAGVQILSSGKFQSPNYSMNLVGWNIDSDGNVEFNNGTFRGTFILGGVIITINNINNLQNSINTVSAHGGGIVNLEPGTYSATSSFTIPSGVTIDGNGATVDFGGTANNFSATGTNPYSTGTLAVNFGSGSVTGTGTTWTAAMIGQSILIGDYWYTITARASNTAITISPVFRAPNVSGVTYVIATTITGISLVNITLQNNITNPLWDFRYVNGLTMDGLSTLTSPQGIRGRDSGIVNWLNSLIQSCTAGMLYNNVPFCTFSNSSILDISGGAGQDFTGVTNSSYDAIAIQNITGVGVKLTNCSNLGIINYSIIECTSHGIECVSGNSALSIDIGEVNTVGGDGIKLTATSNDIEITGNNILNCTGWGINIANANCNRNIIVGNDLSQNNTSGALQDLGTSTKAAANQGASDIPASGGFPIQDVALGASSGALNFVMTSNSTGTVLYIATENGGTISIYRLAKQTNSNVYYVTHTTTQAVAGGSHDVQGLAIVGSSLYMSWTTNAVKSLQRFVAADLTSSTAMTISGTARDGAMWSDGTNLYIFNGTSSQFDKFTISGTTATNAATITYTSAGAITSGGAISDGTSVWLTSTNGTINKYAIAGGSATATTTFILNQTRYPNNGGNLTMFLYGSNILGLGWSFTMSTAASDLGQFVHLSAVDRP